MIKRADTPSQTTTRLIACAIFICALTLYLQSLHFSFVYDDEIQITANQLVNQPNAPLLKNTFEIFRHPTPPGDLYRPLTSLSYFLNVKSFGLSPFMFHLTNMIIYAGCCLLAWLLARQVISDSLVCSLAALIFATHPIHVESVANIVGRGELLAFGFSTLALLTTLKCNQRSEIRFSLSSVTTFILALCGMLAKESATCFVILAPCLVFCVQRNDSRRMWRALNSAIPFILASIVYAALRLIILKDHSLIETTFARDFAENPLLHFGLLERLIPSVHIIGRYIELLGLPLGLSADYSIMPQPFLAAVYSIGGIMISLLPLLLLILMLRYRQQHGMFFGAWFFITFLLTANLLFPIGTLMGDRLSFTPSFGFIAFMCCVGADVLTRRNFIVAGITLTIVFGFLTWQREQVWSDNGTLFKQTITDNPQSPKAYFNYASHLARTSNNIGGVVSLCSKSLELDPNYLLATVCMLDVANAISDKGLIKYWAQRVLELDPQDENASKFLTRIEEN